MQGAHLRTQYFGLKQVKCSFAQPIFWPKASKMQFCAPNILALFYELRTHYWTASTASVPAAAVPAPE